MYQPAGEDVFLEALKLVLEFEGGLSNDPTDLGGLTNYGITHSEYALYRYHKGLEWRSVRDISMDEVDDIYRTTYWIGASCNQMPRATAISVFDWHVNSGKGVTTLQACLGVDVDGIVGHETLNELEYWVSKPDGEMRLLHNYMNYRECCYRRWGHGSQSVFLDGWIDRVESLKKYLKVV